MDLCCRLAVLQYRIAQSEKIIGEMTAHAETLADDLQPILDELRRLASDMAQKEVPA